MDNSIITSVSLAQEIVVHDPVVIKQKDTYYLFCTGKGISVFSSKDLKKLNPEPQVFTEKPVWADGVAADFKNHIWAPDISFHNNTYYLYYSVSAFAKNTSAIGVATNTTLDPKDKNYKWVDEGIVIQSQPNRDMWNAIDPNLIFDENNTPWLSFGSFWEGLKLVKLNPDLKSIAQPQEWHTISKRKRTFELADSDSGNGALEAPFIFKKNGYYYQFISWDLCCRGEKSTYKVVIGRSNNVRGPYLDRDRKPLNEGGGSLVVQGDENYFGAGHNSAYTFNGKDYMFLSRLRKENKRNTKISSKEIKWDADLWPVLK